MRETSILEDARLRAFLFIAGVIVVVVGFGEGNSASNTCRSSGYREAACETSALPVILIIGGFLVLLFATTVMRKPKA